MGKDVLWQDPESRTDDAIRFSGIPYMVLGSRIMECSCGVLRRFEKKRVDNGSNVCCGLS